MPKKKDYIAPIDGKAIGERVKALRRSRGLSQVELAQKLGMDQSLLSRYERGELKLHGALLASLARVFKASADEMLGIKEAKTTPLLQDRRFLRRIHQIDGLSKRRKDALLTTLDAFLGEGQGG